jgi:hypothetical protein
MTKSTARRSKNRLCGDDKIDCAAKIDFAAMTKSTARRSKNQLRGDDKIRCCGQFISNTGAPLNLKEHHLKVAGERMKRELGLTT